jgi:lauroyl/myristoyl acyltransferase
MRELAIPELRTAVRSHPDRAGWGIVDAILALVMLPFALGMGIIDGLAWLIGKLLGG